LDVPVAVVSLVDLGRQWFKSIQGFPAAETPRCISFCQHVVKRKERLGPMVVEDARLDERFKDNPLVANEPFVTFYAGASLISPEGSSLGTFYIFDFQPRKITKAEIRRLEAA
jgi:GAF domain-containing protein